MKEMGEEDIQYKYNKDRLIEDLEERGYDIFRVLIKKDGDYSILAPKKLK